MAPGGRKGKNPVLAGGLAGVFEISMTYPIEYSKTMLQLKPTGAPAFQGPLDVVRWTIRERGVLGLYRGIPSWLFFAFPRVAARFAAYEKANGAVHSAMPDLSPALTKLAAGTVAGAIEGAGFQTPMLAIQTKMNHDQAKASPRYRGFFHAVRTIVKDEGVARGLWPGMWPNVVKSAVNRSIRFAVYGELTDYLRKSRGMAADASLPVWATMGAGFVAGAVSVGVSHPVDTVRVRMQGLEAHKYASSMDCLRQIMQKEGMASLFRGMWTRFGRVTIETSLVFTFYESIDNAITNALAPGKPIELQGR